MGIISDILDAMNEGILPTRPLVSGTGAPLLDDYLDQKVSDQIQTMPAGELIDWMLRHAPPVREPGSDPAQTLGFSISSASIAPDTGYRTVVGGGSVFATTWDFALEGSSLVGSAYRFYSGPPFQEEYWNIFHLFCDSGVGSGLYALYRYADGYGNSGTYWYSYFLSGGFALSPYYFTGTSQVNYYLPNLVQSNGWQSMSGPPTCGIGIPDIRVRSRFRIFPSGSATIAYKLINGSKYYTVFTDADSDVSSIIPPVLYESVKIRGSVSNDSLARSLFGDVDPPAWYKNYHASL